MNDKILRSTVLAVALTPACAMAQFHVRPPNIDVSASSNGGYNTSKSPGTLYSDYNAFNPTVVEHASGSMQYSSVPVVVAHAAISGAGSARGEGSITYDIQVVGPQNVRVPLIAQVGLSSASVTRSGGGNGSFASAEARMWLDNDDAGQNTISFHAQYRDHVADIYGSPLDHGNDFVLNTTFDSRANVDLATVTIDAYAYVGGSIAGGGIADAVLDPYFYIDPTFADASLYHLVFSPGVPNSVPAPEPGSLAAVGLGLAGVAFGRRRRSQP